MEDTPALSWTPESAPVLIAVFIARITSEIVARWDVRVCRRDPNDRVKFPDACFERWARLRLCAAMP
jgi:hypothetical protein